MAEEMTLEENERRFNAALDWLQWTVDAGSGVSEETRKDLRYKALLAV